MSRKSGFFSFQKICRCLWATARTLKHGFLLNPCVLENTKTLENHNLRKLSCMINPILRLIEFLQLREHFLLFLCNHLYVTTYTSTKMRTLRHHNLRKLICMINLNFRKTDFLQFLEQSPLCLGNHLYVKTQTSVIIMQYEEH